MTISSPKNIISPSNSSTLFQFKLWHPGILTANSREQGKGSKTAKAKSRVGGDSSRFQLAVSAPSSQTACPANAPSHPPITVPFFFPSASPGKPRQGETARQPDSQAFPFFVEQKKGNRNLSPYPFFFLRPVPPCITINSWHFWLAH